MTLSGYTIAFDLDGTLVETVGDLHTALNKVLVAEGLPPASLEDVRYFVGQGARALIIRACGAHGIHHDDARLDQLTEAYIDRLCRRHCHALQTVPGPGPGAGKAEGVGRCALRLHQQARQTCRSSFSTALGLAHHFAAVVGGDIARNRKPHPDHFITAIRAAGGDPARGADGRRFVQRRPIRQGRWRARRRLRLWLYGHGAGPVGGRRRV